MSVIITNKGLMKLNRALKPEEDIRMFEVWVTDDPATPDVTDTTAEFCDYTSYNLSPFAITSSYDVNGGVGYICNIGLSQANFTWTKVGIVDESGTLIAESAYTLTKVNTEMYELTFILGGTR